MLQYFQLQCYGTTENIKTDRTAVNFKTNGNNRVGGWVGKIIYCKRICKLFLTFLLEEIYGEINNIGSISPIDRSFINCMTAARYRDSLFPLRLP